MFECYIFPKQNLGAKPSALLYVLMTSGTYSLEAAMVLWDSIALRWKGLLRPGSPLLTVSLWWISSGHPPDLASFTCWMLMLGLLLLSLLVLEEFGSLLEISMVLSCDFLWKIVLKVTSRKRHLLNIFVHEIYISNRTVLEMVRASWIFLFMIDFVFLLLSSHTLYYIWDCCNVLR